jgi:DNA-binding Lrp family transcriptional regulator
MGEEDRQDATKTDRAATERATERPTMHVSRRLTVSEAADELGISAEAVRSRVKRGTLRSTKEGGTVYVLIPGPAPDDQTRPGYDQTRAGRDRTSGQTALEHDRTGDQAELVESLLDQLAYMREQLAEEREARRRADTIMAQLSQANAEQARTIRALEPPRDEPHGPETDAETSEDVDAPTDREDSETGVQRRSSWWRRLFGFE